MGFDIVFKCFHHLYYVIYPDAYSDEVVKADIIIPIVEMRMVRNSKTSRLYVWGGAVLGITVRTSDSLTALK